MGDPSSTSWGTVASNAHKPNKGFFSLEAGASSPPKSRSFKEVLAGSSAALPYSEGRAETRIKSKDHLKGEIGKGILLWPYPVARVEPREESQWIGVTKYMSDQVKSAKRGVTKPGVCLIGTRHSEEKGGEEFLAGALSGPLYQVSRCPLGAYACIRTKEKKNLCPVYVPAAGSLFGAYAKRSVTEEHSTQSSGVYASNDVERKESPLLSVYACSRVPTRHICL
ncbi:hypothetical protein MA16_Dca027410 [Dendrobium catenatum]|uniref:Uncharacterized protein n=1 Tax=Dendrobium catenatum TaxID=906689 RepID=A0A2I0VD43_9ASPA|nr:hypothetical protein MA16_Dca027410 [Dendrobium catenatum]